MTTETFEVVDVRHEDIMKHEKWRNIFFGLPDDYTPDTIYENIPVVPNLRELMKAIPEERMDMEQWHGHKSRHGDWTIGFSYWPQLEPDHRVLIGNDCKTTHCLAGWAVHFAGEQGYELEKEMRTAMAAALILHAAGLPIPDFHGQQEYAVEWLKNL